MDGFEPDLTICDREPITRLGQVQPFGFLLAVGADWKVADVSANIAEFVGLPPDQLLGRDLFELLPSGTCHAIRNRVAILRYTGNERMFRVPFDSERWMDLSLHESDGMYVIEGEPSLSDDQLANAASVRSIIARLDRAGSLDSFHRDAARQLRALTGFDRVMLYRFEPSGAGDIIAESCRAEQLYLGCRFPASDIPRQARELYLRNPFRIIADVGSTPVPLVSSRGEVLDLSQSILRSVSPTHLEYLRNMGVGASLSVSIIVDGQLWGLFACHHDAPRKPSFAVRTAAELFGAMYSLLLESRLHRERADSMARAATTAERLARSLAIDETLIDDIHWMRDAVGDAIPTDGIAICRGGRTRVSGSVPSIDVVERLRGEIEKQQATRSWDCLGELDPTLADHSPSCAGLLAIPLARDSSDCFLLFRAEKVRDLKWGGDPSKVVVATDDGLRLSPRKSFAAYVETVRGRCEPWSEQDLVLANAIRTVMVEVILRMTESISDERRRSSERQDLLIAELNHRVRNILTLIRGLITRSGDTSPDLSSYVASLSGRVQALARAHDQLTARSWRPTPLRTIIETEIRGHGSVEVERVDIEGPDVLIRPEAVATLALVVHELATNSSKYGALSTSGQVKVSLTVDDSGLSLDWVERGGPAVRAPTRRGFGSILIERSIPFELQGRADVNYAIDGFRAAFSIPARHLAQGIAASTVAPIDGAIDPGLPMKSVLKDRRLLLLEDNMLIAIETEEMLFALGASAVTTVSNVRDAREALAREKFDAAVLDISLGGETSFDFAAELSRIMVPFVFASGYGDQVIMESQHSNATVVQKPFEALHLARALERLLAPATS